MNASTPNLLRQSLKVERDALGRFYVVGPNGRYSDSEPETLRQVCEREAHAMQRQAVGAAIDTTVAAAVRISQVIAHQLAEAVIPSTTRALRFPTASMLIQRVWSSLR